MPNEPSTDDALDLILSCLTPLATVQDPSGRCSLPMGDQLAGARRNVEAMAARIAELEAELEHHDEDITKSVFVAAGLRKRAEQAEAEIARYEADASARMALIQQLRSEKHELQCELRARKK